MIQTCRQNRVITYICHRPQNSKGPEDGSFLEIFFPKFLKKRGFLGNLLSVFRSVINRGFSVLVVGRWLGTMQRYTGSEQLYGLKSGNKSLRVFDQYVTFLIETKCIFAPAKC